MLNALPHDVLLKNKKAYDIMLLREQNGSTFTDIAPKYKRSAARVTQIYARIKVKQTRLYRYYIAMIFGYEDDSKLYLNDSPQ